MISITIFLGIIFILYLGTIVYIYLLKPSPKSTCPSGQTPDSNCDNMCRPTCDGSYCGCDPSDPCVPCCTGDSSCDAPCKNQPSGCCGANSVYTNGFCVCNSGYKPSTGDPKTNKDCVSCTEDSDCGSNSTGCIQNKCVCKPGYVGVKCSMKSSCKEGDCGKNGKCDPTGTKCICDDGWALPNCTTCEEGRGPGPGVKFGNTYPGCSKKLYDFKNKEITMGNNWWTDYNCANPDTTDNDNMNTQCQVNLGGPTAVYAGTYCHNNGECGFNENRINCNFTGKVWIDADYDIDTYTKCAPCPSNEHCTAQDVLPKGWQHA